MLMQVPVTKGKGTVTVDTETIPEPVYQEALALGLKVLANRGTSKITKTTYPKEDELHAAAMEAAEKQVVLINTGKIKFTGQKKAKGASGAVMTEARRLARVIVKDELKSNGIKISHVEASEITKAANELLEAMPDLVEQAKANLAEREKKALPDGIDISKLVKVSPTLVAKAEEKKAKAKTTLSAKQAGKPKVRAKPQPTAQA